MIAYVKAELASGKSPAEVRQALLSAGWPPGDVEQALTLSLGGSLASSFPTAPPPPPGAPAGGWSIGPGGARFGFRSRRKPLGRVQTALLGVVFMAAGGLVAYLGLQSYFSTEDLLKNGTRTDGAVLRIEEKVTHDSEGTHRTYRPVIGYETGSGAKIEFSTRMSTSANSYRVGQKVGVIYDPAAPAEAVIDSPGEIYGSSAMPFGLGVIFVIAGAFVVVSALRRPAAAAAVQPGPTPPPLS